jgi:hypothetical protein
VKLDEKDVTIFIKNIERFLDSSQMCELVDGPVMFRGEVTFKSGSDRISKKFQATPRQLRPSTKILRGSREEKCQYRTAIVTASERSA